jgi:anti-sigma-K factor RskA
MEDQDDRLEQTRRRAREVFDASVESLDAGTRARLSRARFEAVEAANRTRPSSWRTWLPAAAVAATVIVAVAIWRTPERAEPPVAVAVTVDAALDAVEMLADGEALDLVENDLAFYEWLEVTGLDAAESAG